MARHNASVLPKSQERESEIQARIMETLATLGITAWRANTGLAMMGGRRVRFGRKGQTDIQGILEPLGRGLWIEVKRPGEELEHDQEIFRASVIALGAEYLIARSVDDVIAWWDGRKVREQRERVAAVGLSGVDFPNTVAPRGSERAALAHDAVASEQPGAT